MDGYVEHLYDYQTIIIYDFQLGFGGIGDCIKFFMYLLEKSIIDNTRLYYLINDIDLEKYIQMRYDKLYIHRDEFARLKYPYTVLNPFMLYDNYNEDLIKMPVQDVFKFSNSVILNKSVIFPDIKEYITLHVRLGDKYLETDKGFVNCKDDIRSYDESELIRFIEKNGDKKILFCCDNNDYKRYIKDKYDSIILVNSEVAHTGLKNTNTKQILDTVTEFYIMTNSEKIVAGSRSGFSLLAAKYRNIEIEFLDTNDKNVQNENKIHKERLKFGNISIPRYDEPIFKLSNNRRKKSFKPMNIT
jgi:hypothetical protein